MDTEYYEAVHTAFYTGLRRGELLALKWGDVDLDMATLSVNRSVYRAMGGQSIYQDPKTVKGRRLIALTPSSALLLRSLWDRRRPLRGQTDRSWRSEVSSTAQPARTAQPVAGLEAAD